MSLKGAKQFERVKLMSRVRSSLDIEFVSLHMCQNKKYFIINHQPPRYKTNHNDSDTEINVISIIVLKYIIYVQR